MATVLSAYTAARPLLYGADVASAEPWLFLTREGRYLDTEGASRWGRPMAHDPDLVAEAVRQAVARELEINNFG